MEENLKLLIARARNGDTKAFGKLVEHYQNRIFSVAYGIIGSRHDAEDIAQDTFIKAYQGIGGLKTEAAFYGWLVRIAINTSLNYKKSGHKTRTIPLDAISEPVYQGETPDAYVENRAGIERVETLLTELPPEHRAVLVLREIEGLSYEEIAAMLDIPLGTVKSRINHARERLRRAVKEKGVR